MSESTADFRARMARIMRERETGKKYSVIGAAPADPCVVRRHDYAGKIAKKIEGMNRAARLTICNYCGSVNQIVNQCGCDPDNLPTICKQY